MAIVVQEGGKNNYGKLLNILTWVVIIATLVAAAYYIFFKRPDLVETAVPRTFEETAELSRIEINASEIIQSASFQRLELYVNPIAPSPTGRANPFSL